MPQALVEGKALGVVTFLTVQVFSCGACAYMARRAVWFSFDVCTRGAKEMCLNYSNTLCVCAQNAMECVRVPGIYPYDIVSCLRLCYYRAVVGHARGVPIPGAWHVVLIH